MNKKKFDAYVEMRARIALRKAGLPLSVKNVEKEMHEIKTQKTRGRPGPVSLIDIIAALESGQEVRNTEFIRCVERVDTSSSGHRYCQDAMRIIRSCIRSGYGDQIPGLGFPSCLYSA
jgi:hypothetical protein